MIEYYSFAIITYLLDITNRSCDRGMRMPRKFERFKSLALQDRLNTNGPDGPRSDRPGFQGEAGSARPRSSSGFLPLEAGATDPQVSSPSRGKHTPARALRIAVILWSAISI
jgi:hypothetical protein